MNTHTRASEPTARRPSARPFPLLSPRAAESGATTRLRVSAAIFTVFSAGKKATRGDVSKTVTMLCVDFAARDPVKDCTAVATTVQFVAREA